MNNAFMSWYKALQLKIEAPTRPLDSMYRFLECKPNVIKGTVLNSKTRTWVANLLDGRLPENRQAIGFLQADIICSVHAEPREIASCDMCFSDPSLHYSLRASTDTFGEAYVGGDV